MFKDNIDFYPTPPKLIEKMLDKLYDMDSFYKYRELTILEPSAGSGNIVDAYKLHYIIKNRGKFHSYNTEKQNLEKVDAYLTFDCVEIDYRLSSILKEKGLNVIWDDFLTLDPPRFYDLIIANVPFSEGVKHALKIIQIQERIGGKAIFLINAETIKNPYSKERQYLSDLLEKYNADIEYIQNAFSDAERETNVEIAMVYIDVPMKDDSTMFEREFDRQNVDLNFKDMQQLVPNMSKIEKLVFECDMIKKNGIELFKEHMKVEKLLKGMGLKVKINLCDDSYKNNQLNVNTFINNTNLEYWEKFINETDLKNRLPSELRTNFSYNMKSQKDINFTVQNAYYFYEELMKSIPESYQSTATKIFDKITNEYAYTESSYNKCIHMYNGWKTNSGKDGKAYRIEKKVIIPCYLGTFSYGLPDVLTDLNIIFENLSGRKYNISTRELEDKIKRAEKKIDTEFFVLDSYKKGTLHVTFKDKNLLDRFNILVAKSREWLPGDFGDKPYEDMNTQEKSWLNDLGINIEEYKLITLNNNYLPRLMG